MSNEHEKTVLRITTPTDVIAAVPTLVGYQPDQHVAVIAVRDDRVIVAACTPLTDEDTAIKELTDQTITLLVRQHTEVAMVVGYGVPERVIRMMNAFVSELAEQHITIRCAIRVEGDRYYSYLCPEECGCDPYGTPFDLADSVLPATAVGAGIAPFSSRAALARSIAPLDGAARAAMRTATADAEQMITDAYDIAPGRARGEHRTASLRFLREAVARYAAGDVLDDIEAAILSVQLEDRRVRDEAVSLAVHDDDYRPHIALWSDMARRVEYHHTPPVLTALALAAWREGDGALANLAVNRALEADPDYRLARIVNAILALGLPPTSSAIPTPDELAEQADDRES